MTTKPRPYQAKGVRKIQHFQGRALLADDMGLGKSAQALWWCQQNLDRGKPVVIVCPKTLTENWRREAIKHVGMRASVLEKMKPPTKKPIGRTDRFYIINYDILGKVSRKRGTWLRWLRMLRPQCVIIDEAHYIKSPGANRTKAVKLLCEWVPHVIALTGTPITSRPAEIFPVINILRPDVFPAFMPFAFRYCAARRTPFGWDFRGASRLKELHRLLNQHCMIRRRKEDVLEDLPSKSRTVIKVKMDRPREYVQAEKEFIKWLSKRSKRKAMRAKNAQELVKLGYLKRLAAELKLKAIINWIDDYLQSSTEKLLVFGLHKNILHALNERYRKECVLIDGGVTGPKRQQAIDRFNNEKSIKLCFGNIQAAGVGWSCTSTSNVLFVELDWVPGNHRQAEDRVHGIGRGTGRGVNVWYLVADGTIEVKICEILEAKQGNLDRALDGKVDGKALDLHRLLLRSFSRAA